MGDLMKWAGYALFILLMIALFDDNIRPNTTFASPGLGIGMGVALGMIAIGYLADIRDAIQANKPEKPNRDIPQEP